MKFHVVYWLIAFAFATYIYICTLALDATKTEKDRAFIFGMVILPLLAAAGAFN